MVINIYTGVVLCVNIAVASINIERTGWLDRVVQYHKNRFYNEILSVAPIEIKATIVWAPAGYVDSPLWDIHSVLHLLTLISESKACVSTRNTLRRMLRPTRRIMMSKQKSYKVFPSLMKDLHNVMYYDMDTDADYEENIVEQFTGAPDDDAVVVVSNPVEARLPSAQISVKLLREILEARANAGRVMPSTTKSPIPWIPMNVTTTKATTNGTSATDNSISDGTKPDGEATADYVTRETSPTPAGAEEDAAAATTNPASAP